MSAAHGVWAVPVETAFGDAAPKPITAAEQACGLFESMNDDDGVGLTMRSVSCVNSSPNRRNRDSADERRRRRSRDSAPSVLGRAEGGSISQRSQRCGD